MWSFITCTLQQILLERMGWVRYVVHIGEVRNVCRILVRKLEGKRPFGRPRHIWEDDIRIDLRAVGQEGMEWMRLSQDRDKLWALVNMVLNIWVA
jgi:hypothetical protein